MTENRKTFFSQPALLFGSAVAIFTINLFVLGVHLPTLLGETGAQISYILVRLVVLVGFSYLMTRFARMSRFQTMSSAMLISFIDQVVLKLIWIRHDLTVHPVIWTGTDTSFTALFYGLSTGFLFFAPFALLLSFVGISLTTLLSDWKK